MIDFKYHIVSLISVFLAIALGIVIGTTALNGPIVTNLKTTVTGLKDDKRSLETRVGGLENQVTKNSEFDAALAAKVLDGTMKDQTFITITVGDGVTAEERDAVIKRVQSAGGKLTGAISLTDGYSDPKQSSNLLAFATSSQPPGVTLPSNTSDGGVVISSLLATMLVKPKIGAEQPGAAITTVLSGLDSLGVLTVDGDQPTPAGNFIIMTGGLPPDQPGPRNTVLVSLAKYLSTEEAAVVIAGDPESAAENGLVFAARADAAAAAAVSTVDNSGVAMGQASVVLALLAEAKGTSGKYGVAEGADPTPPLPGT